MIEIRLFSFCFLFCSINKKPVRNESYAIICCALSFESLFKHQSNTKLSIQSNRSNYHEDMFELKQAIAAIIVCFKPQIFLVVCIILVIIHSIFQAIQRGASSGFLVAKQQSDFTLTITTVVVLVAFIWGILFILLIKYELRSEVECLLTLFHCSKRGLRFLGVVAFHIGLVVLVALLVSMAVEKTLPDGKSNATRALNGRYTLDSDRHHSRSALVERPSYSEIRSVPSCISSDDRCNQRKETVGPEHVEPVANHIKIQNVESLAQSVANRRYISTVYKIWLTAIVYSFLYVVIENLVMFHSDMSLVEFVHEAFHSIVTKLTGIDLSDYPAGEMLMNPLMRRLYR